MTDYFALLAQPRRPWVDPEKLKQAFHEKTLQAHPDANAGNEDADIAFTQINDAYQVLLDPKRRLHHLLALERKTPASGAAPIPCELEDLFPLVATLTQEAERLEQRAALTTNSLSRSLMKAEVMQTQGRIKDALATLRRMENESDEKLRAISDSGFEDNEAGLSEVQNLYVRFSYLTRWIPQLEEKQTQLAL